MKIKTSIYRQLPCMIFLVFSMIILFLSTGARAQNAPVTTIASVGSATPGPVPVAITVTGFTNIGACSLCFDYQYAGLHYLQGIPNPLLPGFAIGDQNLGNGKHRITMGWFGTGVSLPDGSTIMTVNFTYISGITALEFFDNGPSCEYADGAYNVLPDLPTSTYYINGNVCGLLANPGTITGSSAVCQGQEGAGYSIAPLLNATSYIWSVPPGASVVSGNNTNAISVDFSTIATSGNVSVYGVNVCGNGPSSQIPVTVNVLPVANAGPDKSIPYGTSTTLNAASGGSGTFTYHWSPETLLVNPNVQNPQTVSLTTTTLFTLVVTTVASLCQDSDEVVVTVTGGPLNANPLSVPNEICHGSTAQLFANAGGGSGSYSYTWSCTPPGSPPWNSSLANPLVSPDSTTSYHLVLSDGFNTTSGNVSVAVHPLPTAVISGGDTLCGDGNSTLLTVDLTGTPPWSFWYSNGLTSWYIPSQNTTPFTITATLPGVYTVLVVADSYCTGPTSGSAAVAVYPVPPTPVISVNGSELFSSGCCGNQWYKNGNPIAGATSQIYIPQNTAYYTTLVTINGCSSDSSNTVYYIMSGIATQEHSNFSLEPNPARDFFRVSSKPGTSAIREIGIYAITGKREATFSVCPGSGDKDLLINIPQLSPGLYFVAIDSGSGKIILKLIVQ
jgi:hypothetical protein